MSAAVSPPPLPPKKSNVRSSTTEFSGDNHTESSSSHVPSNAWESSATPHHRHHNSEVAPRPQSCPRPGEHTLIHDDPEQSLGCSSTGAHIMWIPSPQHCVHSPTGGQVCHVSRLNSASHCCQCHELSTSPMTFNRARSSTSAGVRAPVFSCRATPVLPSSISCSHGHRYPVVYPTPCCLHATLVSPHCCCVDWLDNDVQTNDNATSSRKPTRPIHYKKDKSKECSINTQHSRKQHTPRLIDLKNKSSSNKLLPTSASQSSKLSARIWQRVKNLFPHHFSSTSRGSHKKHGNFYCQQCGGRDFSNQRPRSSPGTPETTFLSLRRSAKNIKTTKSREGLASSSKGPRLVNLTPRQRSNSYTETQNNSPVLQGIDNDGFRTTPPCVCCCPNSTSMSVSHCIPASSTLHACFAHQASQSHLNPICSCLHHNAHEELPLPSKSSQGSQPASSISSPTDHEAPPSKQFTLEAKPQSSSPSKGQSSKDRRSKIGQDVSAKREEVSSILPSVMERRHMSSIHYTTNNRNKKSSQQADSNVPRSSISVEKEHSLTLPRSRTVDSHQQSPAVMHSIFGAAGGSSNGKKNLANINRDEVTHRSRLPISSNAVSEMVSMGPPIAQPRPNRLTQPQSSPPETSRAIVPVSSSVMVPSVPVSYDASNLTPSQYALQQQRILSFQDAINELKRMGWYWGPISMLEANLLLDGRKDGSFIVRDSCHEAYILSLSLRAIGETYHTRIEHHAGEFSFWAHAESHRAATIVEFIEKAVENSLNGRFQYFMQTGVAGQAPNQVSLLYPLSRFQVVPSLKHLCRFEILAHVRRDHIFRLPLPPILQQYLLEKQYFAENLHEYVEAIRDKPVLPFIFQKARQQQNPNHAGNDSME